MPVDRIHSQLAQKYRRICGMVLERVGKEAVEKDVGDGVLGIGGMNVTKSG